MNNINKVNDNKIEWNKEYVLEVRAEKEKYRGSKDLEKAVHLLSEKIYKDDIHFVLELIQNAEDEGAHELTIFLDQNKVIVKNNGRTFSKKDVKAICSIGGGDKKMKIGFMGIGFKSVFHITDVPQVISGQFNFTIDDYLYPEPQDSFNIESFDYKPKSGAIFVLPLTKKYQDNLDDFSKRLFDVDEKILLFLSNLRKIHFIDATKKTVSKWSYERITDGDLESLINTKKDYKDTWRVFKKIIQVEDKSLIKGVEDKEEIEKTTIIVAFPSPNIESIKNCKREPLYCYLPTEKKGQLPFILQADFIPNAGRNDIDNKPRWNTWLFKKLAQHTAESIIKLQDDKLYFKLFYELIPITIDYYDKEIIEKFLTPLHNSLNNKEIVYCKDTSWHKVENSTLVESDLDELIGVDDCKAIYEGSVYPALVSIFTDSVKDVLSSFEISKIDINDIGLLFKNHNSLTKKSYDWFLDIYSYLARKRQDYNNWGLPEVYEELETIPWLLAHDRTLVAPIVEGADDRLVTYHPKEKNLGILPKIFEDGELVFLHKRLSREKGEKKIDEKRERIRDFIVSQYRVTQFIDPHKIINDVILRKFNNDVYLKYSTKKLVILTNYIRENIKAWINKKKSARTYVDVDELYRELGEMLYLKVNWKVGRNTHKGFMKPTQAYISGRRKARSKIYEMFSQLDEAPFISGDYYNTHHVRGYSKADMVSRGRNVKSMPWDEFFKKIGAWETPRVIPKKPISIDRYSSSWSFIKKLPGEVNDAGYTVTEDWVMPEFEKVIETYNSMPRKGKKLLVEFSNQIRSKWANYNKYKTSVIEWHFHRPFVNTIDNSTFLYALQTRNWFSGNGNPLSVPDQYFLSSEKNKNLLPPDTQFIHDERFKTFYKDIGVQEKPEREKVFTYFKTIRKEWQKGSFPDNYTDILSNIYSYLLADDSIDNYLSKFKRFKSVFIPTEEQLWWHPSRVFWNDHLKTFGRRRNYLEKLYPTDAKESFKLLGVEEDPSIDSCIAALNEIKETNEIDYEAIRYINDIYRYLDKVVNKEDGSDYSVLSQPLFVSKKKKFHSPEEIFYVDDPWYERLKIKGVEVLYSIYPYHIFKNFLRIAGVQALSDNYSIKCKYTGKSSFTKADSDSIITMANYLKPYVQYTDPDAPGSFFEKLDKLRKISVYRVDSLSLQLIQNDGKKVDEEKNKDVFLQKHNLDLIVINDGNPLTEFSEPLSHELYRLFWEFGYPELKPIIKELIECETLEDKNIVIQNYGTPDEIIESGQDTGEHVLLEGKKDEKKIQDSSRENGKAVIKSDSETPQIGIIYTETDVVYRSWDEITHIKTVYNPDNGEDYGLVSEGRVTKGIREPVKTNKIKSTPIIRRNTSALRTEDHALNIVMSFENEEGRNPIDVHDQKRVGYDIKCDNRFIEVKSFSGKKGQITITPYEFKAARKFEEHYYIYVVSQLTTEFGEIEIEIIQNPINTIDFEITGNRVAKNFNGEKIVYLECRQDSS
jgi:hypothetical protein